MSPPRKTVQQYEAEATRLANGCLIHYTGLACKIYQMRHGPIADKQMQVCHSCDEPRCIEDTHHWLGTQQENMIDASNKKRLIRSLQTKAKVSSSKIGKGIGNTNAKGHRHSKSWKDTHSKYMKGNSFAKGNKLSTDTRTRMSVAKLGNVNGKGNKGKAKSKDHREAISRGLCKFNAG